MDEFIGGILMALTVSGQQLVDGAHEVLISYRKLLKKYHNHNRGYGEKGILIKAATKE